MDLLDARRAAAGGGCLVGVGVVPRQAALGELVVSWFYGPGADTGHRLSGPEEHAGVVGETLEHGYGLVLVGILVR
jgi:hypothetical protein